MQTTCNRLKRLSCLTLAIAIFTAGCQSETPPPANTTAEQKVTASAAHEQLHRLFADYREALLLLNPLYAMFEGDYRFNHILGDSLSADYLERSHQLEERFSAALAAIDPLQLNDDDRLSYDIFKYDREMELERFRGDYAHMATLLPINQFYNMPSTLAIFGSGESAQPFNTLQDHDNWLLRVGEFPAWVEQAISNLRQGVQRGVVLPRVLVERILPQLSAHLVDEIATSIFYKPLLNLPESFTREDRARLTAAYEATIRDDILPAYRRLHDFLAEEYLPHARETVGIGHLPGGQEWYAYLARNSTTTGLTPEEIHEIGRQEATRLFAEMEAIRQEVGFEGDMQAFLHHLRTDPRFFHASREALLGSYTDLKPIVEAALPRLFELLPRADYVIAPIEAFREVSKATAEYQQPAPDGSRPGKFYVNTYKLDARPTWQREALFVHEAVPGHHFQISIAMEQEHLPKFQRFDGPTAYTEGWGLYAETLGGELGLYTDPYQRMGALVMQIWRADRLVVDTGMHAMGWTREQAIEFMLSNLPLAEVDIIAEVERYLAIPGQALAYKIGQTRFSELRRQAEEALGDNFDIRAFHREVLKDGAMPMAILERKINTWIERQRTGAATATLKTATDTG